MSVVDSLLNLPHPDLRTELVTFKRRKFDEDYELVELISQAPNSRLYRVIERRTAKEYIAKVANKPEYADWLRREADCLNQIAQAGVSPHGGGFVSLHDAYETAEKSLVLVYDEIKNSRHLIEHAVTNGNASSLPLDEKQIAIYIKQLLECLSTLHSRNIVHLDVNPGNIVIDKKTKRLNLIGFTHAKCLKPDTYSNQSLVYYHDYGQVEFVSPEVVTHTPITLNTDMWSVGVLTYMLLTGVSPFSAETDKDTLIRIANNKWSMNKDLFKNISHDAKDFLQKLLLPDAKERMTATQALNHPWIHYALQQIPSAATVGLDKQNLLELHSRTIWHRQQRHTEPWLKLQRISCILAGGEDNTDQEKENWQPTVELSSTIASSNNNNTNFKKAQSVTFSEQLHDREISTEPSGFVYGEDDERLNPGSYLLPVKDPLFTVRLREYRRNRYEKVKQIESMLFDKFKRDDTRMSQARDDPKLTNQQ